MGEAAMDSLTQLRYALVIMAFCLLIMHFWFPDPTGVYLLAGLVIMLIAGLGGFTEKRLKELSDRVSVLEERAEKTGDP
jgi:uncharacterized ion transporter superfamily protein YfcC